MINLKHCFMAVTFVFIGAAFFGFAHAQISVLNTETQRKIATNTDDKTDVGDHSKKTKEKDETTSQSNTSNDNSSSANRWRQMNARDLIR